MDELQKWIPEARVVEEGEKDGGFPGNAETSPRLLEADRLLQEADFSTLDMERRRELVRRYLRLREPWLEETPEGRMIQGCLSGSSDGLVHCSTLFDLYLADLYAPEAEQLKGLEEADWFGLFSEGRAVMTTGGDGYIGFRHCGLRSFAAGLFQELRRAGLPVEDRPLPEVEMPKRLLLTQILGRLNRLPKAVMKRCAVSWDDDDPREGIGNALFRPVNAPGKLGEVHVDLDDPEQRKGYLSACLGAAYDGFLTPEQAEIVPRLFQAVGDSLREGELEALLAEQMFIHRLNKAFNGPQDSLPPEDGEGEERKALPGDRRDAE